jgi:hypothetical protein
MANVRRASRVSAACVRSSCSPNLVERKQPRHRCYERSRISSGSEIDEWFSASRKAESEAAGVKSKRLGNHGGIYVSRHEGVILFSGS